MSHRFAQPSFSTGGSAGSRAVPLLIRAALVSFTLHAGLIVGLLERPNARDPSEAPVDGVVVELVSASLPGPETVVSPPQTATPVLETPHRQKPLDHLRSHPVTRQASTTAVPEDRPPQTDDLQDASLADPAAQTASMSSASAEPEADPLLLYGQVVWTQIVAHKPGRRVLDHGVVSVLLVLSPDGDLLDVRLERSSGSPTLDRLTLETIHAAAPFPRPPDGLAGRLSFTLPFEYR
ncbi:TonB family protein [Telmatospirillum sp.]|uniref:energy transducer TonB family protein n=1 Tax=Telmatospirillum sp. TaxID=2079197 RepID=UPI002843B2AF|nr:TonB family protein [Telmatospirillum sp.]MDR3440483.1 TonB family protein [Telmatospirillum sp.]